VAVNEGGVIPHELLARLDELLLPQTLGELTGSTITSVRQLPFAGGHSASGSRFFAVETNDGRGPRFVVKRVSREWDWIMRATDDDRGREALAWTSGLLDRLPPELTHPIVAAARDGDGWAILMHDVSDAIIPPHDPYVGAPIAAADHSHFLDGLAAMHATYWDEPASVDPALGFCTPEHRYRSFAPETGRREGNGPDFYPRIIREGWSLLPGLVDPAVADLGAGLADDPTPLTTAQARYPQTIVHGDPRPPNLGLLENGASSRAILLDWHFVGPGTPGVDLTWYLYTTGPGRALSPEAVIACYRERLARRLGSRFDEDWWQPQLELSLLGQFLRCAQDLAWAAVHHESASTRAWARAGLEWWSERVKAGERWL
jgi:hypothetical protein